MSTTLRMILFVCSRNRRRSLTAERIFEGTQGWEVRPGGTEDGAGSKLPEGNVGRADVVVVRARRRKDRLRQKFLDLLRRKWCVCLFIADDCELMDPALVALLGEKMRDHFPELG